MPWTHYIQVGVREYLTTKKTYVKGYILKCSCGWTGPEHPNSFYPSHDAVQVASLEHQKLNRGGAK